MTQMNADFGLRGHVRAFKAATRRRTPNQHANSNTAVRSSERQLALTFDRNNEPTNVGCYSIHEDEHRRVLRRLHIRGIDVDRVPAHTRRMAKKPAAKSSATVAAPVKARKHNTDAKESALSPTPLRASSLLDTRVIYCGDNLEQLAKLPDACVDLIYIDPPFNSNRNYEVFWGETKEKRAFEDRHENTRAYIDYMRPRCVQLARVLKRPAAFITTATGTPATTSRSCSTRFSAKTI